MNEMVKVSEDSKKEWEAQAYKETVIVTSTSYPHWYSGDVTGEPTTDKVRGDLCFGMISTAIEKGIRVVVVDSQKSSAAFKRGLLQIAESQNDLLQIYTETRGSRGEARRQGCREAQKLENAKILAYVDAEKVPFVRHNFLQGIVPMYEDMADIVVVGRDGDGFRTIPPEQKMFEERANRFWTWLLKRYSLLPEIQAEDIDIMMGVRFFRNEPNIVDIFCREYEFDKTPEEGVTERRSKRLEDSDPELWAGHFLPITEAYHERMNVTYVVVPYRHPENQTRLETGSKDYVAKRQRQFNNVMMTTNHLIASYEDHSGVRIMRKN